MTDGSVCRWDSFPKPRRDRMLHQDTQAVLLPGQGPGPRETMFGFSTVASCIFIRHPSSTDSVVNVEELSWSWFR